MSRDWDAIVIGAGPAGMAAAATLAEGGARTLLLDEQAEPGGQIYRAIERNRGNARLSGILGPDYLYGTTLTERLRASGAHLRFSSTVWRVEPGAAVWSRTNGTVALDRAKALVIATGAMERPVPLAGWTLPGVMTVGALQVLLKTGGLVPSGKLVLAGTGPLFYLFARQCLDAGVEHLTLLDTARSGNIPAALLHLPRAFTGQGWRYLAKGAGLLASLRVGRVKLLRGVSGITIEGEDRATAIRFRVGKTPHRLTCDLVGLHEGVIPQQQIPRSLGCPFDWNDAQSCFQPRRDAWGASTLPGIFIAGDAGGIIGAQASRHEGDATALAVLAELGRITPTERDARLRSVRHARDAHLSARPFLDRLYRPGPDLVTPPDPVTICRCEAVCAGSLRQAVERGALGPSQAKVFLRVGMGPCQGRLCGPSVTGLIARETGRSEAEIGYYRIRDPIKPVTVGELASASRRGAPR
ncbi:FAD/NAD(P)-dependent oxidoreductase [Bosea thiooxidans]|nr:NAD(P)/FAD-dependent oxidoreductase [Bosea sp. (in: a-proteobacteria)]